MQIQLSLEESLALARERSYWDGVVAGARIAADHAQQMRLKEIIASHQPTPPPAQQEPSNDA